MFLLCPCLILRGISQLSHLLGCIDWICDFVPLITAVISIEMSQDAAIKTNFFP